MDLESLLSDLPSGTGKELMIREVDGSDEKFRELLEFTLKKKDPLSWRAAWILDSADERYPGLASAYISRLVNSLPSVESTGTLRCLLRLLCRYDIEEEDQGLLIDLCFSYMVSELYPVAVKVHAMEIIYQHCLIYPELKEELITIIRDQIANNSVGFLSRGRRIIKQLEA
jgi:hypothetical protein